MPAWPLLSIYLRFILMSRSRRSSSLEPPEPRRSTSTSIHFSLNSFGKIAPARPMPHHPLPSQFSARVQSRKRNPIPHPRENQNKKQKKTKVEMRRERICYAHRGCPSRLFVAKDRTTEASEGGSASRTCAPGRKRSAKIEERRDAEIETGVGIEISIEVGRYV
jgi:hypothetical protein